MDKQKFLQFNINGSPNQLITVIENFSITIEAQIGEKIFSSKFFTHNIPSDTTRVFIDFKPFFEKIIYTPTEEYHYQNMGLIRITSLPNNQSEASVIVLNNKHQYKLNGIFYLLWLELLRQNWVLIDKEHEKSEKISIGNEELLTNVPVFLKNKIFSINYYESFEQEINRHLSKSDIFLEPLISVNYKQIQQESTMKFYLFGNLGDNNGEVLFGCIDKTKQAITAYCLVNIFWALDFFDKLATELGIKPTLPNTYINIKNGNLIRTKQEIKDEHEIIEFINENHTLGDLYQIVDEKTLIKRILIEFANYLNSLPIANELIKKAKSNHIENKHEWKKQREDNSNYSNWFPKKVKTLKHWAGMFHTIQALREDYIIDYKEGKTDNPKPSIEDYVDAITLEHRRKYCNRRIRQIIEAGERGWLSNY